MVRRPSHLDEPAIAESGSRPPRRHRAAAVAILLLLAIIVLPPFININRFRRGIIRSISAGLGRPVQASSVELQLFPLPGFVLHNFTVAEDPAYGAEPVMTAASVTAIPRASTLWHRRVEIATLRFDTPSVNLVRNASGEWNFQSLLRNSPVLHRGNFPAASSDASAGTPVPFPYVEASSARINIKLDREKLPFSLEQANLSFWKESANQWRIRIRARPVRTDLTVAATGELRAEGSLTTAGALILSPLQARIEWRRVQLGEISRLLSGEDDGWRGTVDWTAHAGGTLQQMTIASDITVEEFRRAEFIPSSEMDLAAHCQAQYALARRQLSALDCDAPAGDGYLRLRQVQPTQPGNPASLRFAVEKVPAGFFLDLLRHVHPGVAAAAAADGEVNGEWNCDGLAVFAPSCHGAFRTTTIHLTLPHLDHPVALTPLELLSGVSQEGDKAVTPGQPATPQMQLRLMPAHLSLGGPTPLTLSGVVAADGFSLQLQGPASLESLGSLGAAFRVPGIPHSAGAGEIQSLRGAAQLAVTLDGHWLPRSAANPDSATPDATQTWRQSAFAPTQWSGVLQVHAAQLRLLQLPGTVQLASAQVNFSPAGIEWTGIDAAWGHNDVQGSVQWQPGCPQPPSNCGAQFSLHTRLLDLRRLQAAWQAGNSSSFLDQMNPWADRSPRWNHLSGTVTANVLSLGKIQMKNVRADLRLQDRTAELEAISGEIFGGTLAGSPDSHLPATPTGTVRWDDGTLSYWLRLQLQRIQPDRVGALWQEHWGPGTADVQLNLETRGRTASQLAQNATGNFDVLWKNGAFHPSGEANAAAAPWLSRFQLWQAKGAIRQQALVLTSSRLQLARIDAEKQRIAPSQAVTGNIAFSRDLHLRLAPSGIEISGSLSAPVLARAGQSSAPGSPSMPPAPIAAPPAQ